uniref:Bax inhibitor 1 n=1 Tax=Parascaris equorum TaxID=6256 RepID=A0A914R6J9_PAREQ
LVLLKKSLCIIEVRILARPLITPASATPIANQSNCSMQMMRVSEVRPVKIFAFLSDGVCCVSGTGKTLFLPRITVKFTPVLVETDCVVLLRIAGKEWTFREKDVLDHLRAVYGTLFVGLMVATAGAVLEVMNVVRANLFLTLGSFACFFALCAIPHSRERERQRFGCFTLFAFLTVYFVPLDTGFKFMMMTVLWMGLAITCALILYDTQLICEKRRRGDTDYIWHTIELFLDFINLFRYILVILNSKEVCFLIVF